ncbi:MAG TPA: helix-turn-helix domain-containing protein [Pseudonocardiaceae bacterium]
MVSNPRDGAGAPTTPDYELTDLRLLSTEAELRALGGTLRATLLDLLLERAATVTELATAVGRPKSTVAHHVSVLVRAGLLRVVRTRRVRAIEERFYGRTARIFYVAPLGGPGDPWAPDHVENYLVTAATESAPAHQEDRLRAILRHARIPRESAAAFWERVFELTREFSALPRSGDTVYAFVAGLYPSDHPSLPEPEPGEDGLSSGGRTSSSP